MYKWLNSLLENKNFQMKESASCIDFETLCTMKPKQFVELQNSVVKPVLIKSNHKKLDREVLKYIQRNHAASDLALNQKQIGRRLSLPMIVNTKENITVRFAKFVGQRQINAINSKHCYAVSDLALNEKRFDKRLSLPIILACTENQAPLYSCTCISNLSTCEPTTLFKFTGKDSNGCNKMQIYIYEKIVKRSKECLYDKEIDIFKDDSINDLNFLHGRSHRAANQKGVELQSLVPVNVEDTEKGPLELDFNDNKELKSDNEKKVKEGRFRKVFKRVRNLFKKYF